MGKYIRLVARPKPGYNFWTDNQALASAATRVVIAKVDINGYSHYEYYLIYVILHFWPILFHFFSSELF